MRGKASPRTRKALRRVGRELLLIRIHTSIMRPLRLPSRLLILRFPGKDGLEVDQFQRRVRRGQNQNTEVSLLPNEAEVIDGSSPAAKVTATRSEGEIPIPVQHLQPPNLLEVRPVQSQGLHARRGEDGAFQSLALTQKTSPTSRMRPTSLHCALCRRHQIHQENPCH